MGNNSVTDRPNTVSVGSPGNERIISNVKAGVRDTDATNVGQVKEMISSSEGRTNQKLHRVDRNYRAGVAGAAAIASIPQATKPGGRVLGLGVGNHRGESAVAVGYSRATDNNKVILKLGATVDSRGHYTTSAGIGYQW
ncbi:YadA family autotransporter adhesin [Rodentibacter haemolyticus]|uniref:YadA-like family protein n=1 Tax=Rodentibacter haemolyticus TaxID=2778911 RepID=A0ABX6UX79_9PAST|nr:YadA-like family protein [Rodentibacter haemolyticus]QPB42698.1 YadA-like family protein [Rodentibacter haemolyticus]